MDWNEEILSSIVNENMLVFALFSSDGMLLHSNEALKKISPNFSSENLINPSFEELKQQPFIKGNLIFNEQLTVGSYERTDNISFPVCIYKKADNFLIIGRKDSDNLIAQNQQLLMLNQENSNLQRQILKDKKKLEYAFESLDNVNRKLEEEIQTKDKFFSIIGHDLKTPFSGLLGLSSVLLESINELSKDEIKYNIKLIHTSANNFFNLLSQLLEWGSVKRNKIQFRSEQHGIKKLITETIDLLTENAKKKNIDIQLSVPDKLTWYLDANIYSSIIRNLLSNALKFTSRDGRIKISVQHDEDNLKTTVTDNGIGMAEEKAKTLFESDFVESTIGTEREKGTGLGLSLCKEFVEIHGGTIVVTSKINAGTSVNFTIPSQK
ncbi:sensor histidine kinase [Draconibacterium halophilum]|uniref:histidine kinase n=1 Tax=Draconibacterium halophilum TaxID=2706887 RepID=A0A6C0RFF7_9BACT|nr:HAMP domain-containing sensor histidine kinase [Draconibacterium halophilum]QIA09254.1 HAMP domain-containing histidine kinase [Draconibacterium halophilum]